MGESTAHPVVRLAESAAPDGSGGEPSPLRVARQPILDASSSLLAYELLFDDAGPRHAAGAASSDLSATSAVVVEGLLDVGLFDLVGDRVAHVNVARDFLVHVQPLPLPPDRMVLELEACQRCDAELEAVLMELRQRGFVVALDNYAPGEDSARLLPYAAIVKVGVESRSDEELTTLVAGLREHRPPLRLIATDVESGEDFERCRKLGFEAFQGFFFARPAPIGRDRLPSQGLTALRAMTELHLSDDFDELHRIITRDAGLGMRVLRYANSAFVALPRRVGSVQEALTWLGADAVRRFALMVALSGSSDVPSELLVTALVRARMCELLCGGDEQLAESAFTVGLFSVADALANTPMQNVVDELPLREDIATALLTRTGELGELLRAVIAYQYGNFTAASPLMERRHDVEAVYRDAVKWADLSFAGLV